MLNQEQSANVFDYIKQISYLSDLRNEETGEKILAKRFDKIAFVGNDVALAKYLNPSLLKQNSGGREYIPIFPFGCNNSQYQAVKSTMENQISVIQGPPGTGKTQTILNIIANILMQGKTVQIVSNNNSATENVYEKLSSIKYNPGFIAATLGNSNNKKTFIEEQAQLTTEITYFNQYIEETDVDTDSIKTMRKLSARQWMALWQECRMTVERKQKIALLFRLKGFLQYGISNSSFYRQDIAKIITTFQAMYYRAKEAELTARIAEIESFLQSVDNNLLDNLCNQSMTLLKDELAGKYEDKRERRVFTEEDF